MGELRLNTFKNIIFDLGGVLMEIDPEKSQERFAELSGQSMSYIQEIVIKDPVFIDYEKGIITDAQLRDRINELLKNDIGELDFEGAWNAMLGVIPERSFELLKNLAPEFQLYCISNTNNLHLKYFKNYLKQIGRENLNVYFKKVYFSCLMGMRKPDVQIYETVLSENQLNPSETLFIDDMEENTQGAASLGLSVLRIEQMDHLFEFFYEDRSGK